MGVVWNVLRAASLVVVAGEHRPPFFETSSLLSLQFLLEALGNPEPRQGCDIHSPTPSQSLEGDFH
jgi:hypothetical protein